MSHSNRIVRCLSVLIGGSATCLIALCGGCNNETDQYTPLAYQGPGGVQNVGMTGTVRDVDDSVENDAECAGADGQGGGSGLGGRSGTAGASGEGGVAASAGAPATGIAPLKPAAPLSPVAP